MDPFVRHAEVAADPVGHLDDRPSARTSAITRYRRWTRIRSVRSFSFTANTRRSLRVNDRNFTELAIRSLLGTSVESDPVISRQTKFVQH
jgi:hypothetical protein